MKNRILWASVGLIALSNFIIIYLTFKNIFLTMYTFLPTYISVCFLLLLLLFFISRKQDKRIRFFIFFVMLQSGSVILAQESTEKMTTKSKEKIVFQKIGNKKAPLFEYERIISLNENSNDTISFGEKYTLINFWATWCPPCLKEMPMLQDFHEKYREKGVNIIGITGFYTNSDKRNKEEALKKMKAILNDLNISYNVILDKKSRMLEAYMAKTLPLTILIDSNHVIQEYKIGIRGAQKIMKKVKNEIEIK